jgi:SAM-dependent methyltransferase
VKDRSRNLIRFFPEARVGGFTAIDGTVEFYQRVAAILSPDATMLDVGCGRGLHTEDEVAYRRRLRDFRRRARRVIGIDPDEGARVNPTLDEFRLIDDDRWPVEDATIDIVLADWVIEHVRDPDAFFVECSRVLRHGGYVCARTTNTLGYVGLISRLVPTRHHRALGRAQPDRKTEDIFPTLYRCNTVDALRRALHRSGLDACVYGHEAEPRYLEFSSLAYAAGIVYQRLAPRRFANALLVFARKSA